MYLKTLELTGFKSFAKKATLEFNSPISAIVGPNGSGKSNVAEGFRFVLGEQSMKSMRGRKTEDLIFNGGESQSRANRASVKLVFDNTKRLLNVDFDEVSIERVIHRDSLSEYFINGTQVRLKDVIEMLSAAHIGASGHHMISQGEADRILNANSRERREMIEDALGLKIYQYKKEESLRKLERTKENMEKVESLRKEIAPHLKFLRKQVEKVEKTLALREELKSLYRDYLKREDIFIKETKKRIETESHPLKTKLHDLEKELSHARKVLEDSKSKDAKSDKVMKLESELASTRKEKDAASRDIGRIEGEISSLRKVLERELKEKDKEDAQTMPLREVRALKESIDRIDPEKADIGTVKEAFIRVKEALKGFVERYKALQADDKTKALEEEIKGLEKERKDLEKKFKGFEHAEEELLSSYKALQSEIDKEKDSSRDAEKAMFKIVAEQNEARAKLSIAKMEEDKLALIETDFKREKEEGAALIGRDVYLFESAEGISPSTVMMEERHAQEDRRKAIERVKVRIEDSGALSADDVMKEFKEANERDEFLAKEMLDLEKSAESLTALIEELDEKLDSLFSEGIGKINKQFKEFFALMFGGGAANLSVTKEKKRKRISQEELEALGEGMGETEPEEEETEIGVAIEVNLPRKKIKSLEMLSGGERALTSIALLFAISQVNPPPFIVLDETDAALDEANSKKYGDMIENLSKFSQLIVITHNRETMSRAGVLYGVTMGREGYSKLLSIAFNEALTVAK